MLLWCVYFCHHIITQQQRQIIFLPSYNNTTTPPNSCAGIINITVECDPCLTKTLINVLYLSKTSIVKLTSTEGWISKKGQNHTYQALSLRELLAHQVHNASVQVSTENRRGSESANKKFGSHLWINPIQKFDFGHQFPLQFSRFYFTKKKVVTQNLVKPEAMNFIK
jgi:hypothetical protein